MHVNGSGTCHGDGCNRRPVSGMSYCSEDHYDELVDERKSKNGYRSSMPTGYTHITPPSNAILGEKVQSNAEKHALGDSFNHPRSYKPATSQAVPKKATRQPVDDLPNVKLKSEYGAVTWTVVSTAEVPTPPRNTRAGGRFLPLYKAIRALPAGQAVQVAFTPHRSGKERELDSCRRQLRVNCKKDGLELMSSRNADATLGWFWVVKP